MEIYLRDWEIAEEYIPFASKSLMAFLSILFYFLS